MALSKTDRIKYTEATAAGFLHLFLPKPIVEENLQIPWLPSSSFKGGNAFTAFSHVLVAVRRLCWRHGAALV